MNQGRTMEERLAFCSLGMFIIGMLQFNVYTLRPILIEITMQDEIEYVGGRTLEKVVIVGAGSYAAIGARLVAGERYAKLVGWIVDVGSDFPREFRSTIESWHTTCLFREDGNRLTTRAWNGYSGENGHRGEVL
jgi:hypothetical protein